jgi:hypothetical protein
MIQQLDAIRCIRGLSNRLRFQQLAVSVTEQRAGQFLMPAADRQRVGLCGVGRHD